jgi:cell wall-associated NlpC family hydrolase
MLEAVDSYLRQARELLGSGHSPAPASAGSPRPYPQSPATWSGAAATGAAQRSAELGATRGQLHSAHVGANRIISAAAEIPTSGHRALTAIETSWAADKAALAPYARTAAGKAALLQAGQLRIAETQTLMTQVANRYGDAAAAITAARQGLPHPNGDTPGAAEEPAATPGRAEDPEERRDDDPQSAVAGAARPHPTSGARPATAPAPPMATYSPPMASMPAAAPPAAPLTSTLPAATSSLPSLASSAPTALTPLTQPLSQIGTVGQSVLASQLSSGDRQNLSERRERDPRSKIREDIVDQARRALGLPYVWGGGGARGPSGGGFDCSGLTQFAVAQASGGQVILPRTTYDQINCGQAVAPAQVRPGDLVFSNFSRRGPEHVQIFAGVTAAGVPMVIEAQQRGVPVKFSELSGPAVFRRVI